MPASTDNPNAPRLCFDSHQDAINYVRLSVENANRWLATNNLDLVKRYTELDLHIVLNLRFRTTDPDYDLVFSAVPNWRYAYFPDDSLAPHVFEVHSANGKPDGNKYLVFVGVREFIDGPEEVIPSFVRLESSKHRNDLLREVLAFPLDAILQPTGAVAEGKVGMSGNRSASAGVCNSVPRQIQSLSEIDDNVGGGSFNLAGNWVSEFNLGYLVSTIRVGLSNTGVCCGFEEGCNLPIKINNMFLCAGQAES